MTPKRKSILKRAAKSLAAMLIAAVGGAILSPAFADFVGDHTLTAIIIGSVPPVLLTLNKALQRWNP